MGFGPRRRLSLSSGGADSHTKPSLEDARSQEAFQSAIRAHAKYTTSLPCELGVRLGNGGDSDVYAVGERQALKTISIRRPGSEDLRRLLQEVRIAGALTHPHIVSLSAVSLNADASTLYLLLERGDETLEQALNRARTTRRPPCRDFTYRVAADVAAALAYLHSKSVAVVHRDLKPSNVLLFWEKSSEGRLEPAESAPAAAKLIDFGSACHCPPMAGERQTCGTTRWMAPECIELQGFGSPRPGKGPSPLYASAPSRTEPPPLFASDIWSFGLLLAEMLTLTPPYANVLLSDVRETVLAGVLPKLPPPLDPENAWMDALASLARRCLLFSPLDRPSSLQILSVLVEGDSNGAGFW